LAFTSEVRLIENVKVMCDCGRCVRRPSIYGRLILPPRSSAPNLRREDGERFSIKEKVRQTRAKRRKRKKIVVCIPRTLFYAATSVRFLKVIGCCSIQAQIR